MGERGPTLAGFRKVTGFMKSVLFLGGRNHMHVLGNRYGRNVFPACPGKEGKGGGGRRKRVKHGSELCNISFSYNGCHHKASQEKHRKTERSCSIVWLCGVVY